MQNFAHGSMRIFIKAPVLGIGAVIMAFFLNPKMAMIPLAIVPLVIIVISLNLKISYPIFMRIQRALDKVNGVMREYLAGIRVVKAFNRFTYERDRFQKVNKNLKDINLKGNRTIAIFNPIVALMVNIGIVLVLWYGGLNVNSGDMEVGKIMAFVNYMTQVLFSLIMMTRILTMFIRAKASSDRISEVFATENTMDLVQENKEFKDEDPILEFDQVFFKYHDKSNWVLEDISFKINKGETLGIIGSTGSGKSSLISLIPRFYDPVLGKVKFKGNNIRELSLESLRDKIAMVPQKVLLFTGTIGDNIRWGDENASQDEVEKVAKIAEAHDFIETFNQGYDTYLGQGGVNLSGGQKQRISIARALIKKPEILILDDSTSAVDLITERKIRTRLKDYLKETTTILIAQRITSVMDADKILVLNRGKIVGFGHHNDLMSTCQVYGDIYYSQLGKEEIVLES